MSFRRIPERGRRQVITACQKKLTRSRRTKRMRLDELTLPPLLRGKSIEDGIDRVGRNRRIPVIVLELKKGAVVARHVPIDSPREEAVLVWNSAILSQCNGAGHGNSQSALFIRKPGASEWIGQVAGNREPPPWSAVIEAEYLIVEFR